MASSPATLLNLTGPEVLSVRRARRGIREVAGAGSLLRRHRVVGCVAERRKPMPGTIRATWPGYLVCRAARGRLGETCWADPPEADSFRSAGWEVLGRRRHDDDTGTDASGRSARDAPRRSGHPGASAGPRRGSARLDERRQRALIRYYLAAGRGRAGGRRAHDAVRDPRAEGTACFRPVLELAAEEIRRGEHATARACWSGIGGVCGRHRAGGGRGALALESSAITRGC